MTHFVPGLREVSFLDQVKILWIGQALLRV